MNPFRMSGRRRVIATFAAGVAAVGLVTGIDAAVTTASAAPAHHKPIMITSTGLRAGQIKHVWLIILENKSYDATFSGLNQNSYLWKTLPSQGVLLKNYYGTGHYSMDNYLSLVSGQAPEQDTQSDCSVEDSDIGTNADIVRHGADRGQVASPAGANSPVGTNGCTYPSDTPTLFNQLDAAHKTWKGYAQDLGDQPNREAAVCGGPGTSANNPATNPTYMSATQAHPFPSGVTTFTGAQANDQYVAKHFPFPWFHSLTGTVRANGTTAPGLTKPVQGGTDCDAAHIANLDSPSEGLYHDLQKVSTTPAFSWITPDNCNDAHDASCKGNNMSGSFTSKGQPIYQSPTPDPQSTTPKNYTGGLYASDLFLEYYLPMIERSPAFKQGGLIDITFDEANPPFTYTGNSFNNANAYGPTSKDKPDAATAIKSDLAGENLHGRNVDYEPTGVNSTLKANSKGQQLYPGPGDDAFVDRPPACTSTNTPANCVQGEILDGASTSPGQRTDAVAANSSSSFVSDPSIVATDTGRMIVASSDGNGGSPIPANTFVGTVSNSGPLYPTKAGGAVVQSSFQLVDQDGDPVTPTGPVSSITLSAEGEPGHLQAGETPDPLFDADDATPGGGDTGSVLISPFIKPGTVSTRYYNHYSWLRTMEDIFQVSRGDDHRALPAGSVSGGLDGLGHLGFAAQSGLAPFGPDVFNNAQPRRVHRRHRHHR